MRPSRSHLEPSRKTRRISVGGGKGGVGKSLIASNLAVAIARMGRRVTLVDADLGAANLHTLVGVERCAPTLRHFLAGDIDSLDEAAHETGIENLRLVAGIGAVPGAPDATTAQRQRLFDGITALEDDVVIIDCGAGASNVVVDLFCAADLRLMVMAPQLTSIQNAYGFLKAAIHRSLARWAETKAQRALVAEAAAAPEAGRLGDWIKSAWRSDPVFVERALRGLDHFGARIVGNQLFDEEEAGMLLAFSRMARDLLRVEAPVLASLCASRAIHESVNQRRPFVLDELEDAGARAITDLADAVLHEDIADLRAAAGLVPPPAEETAPPADMSLPKNFLRFYVRRHRRLMVDWVAALDAKHGASPVRVCEVSLGGALVNLDGLPELLSVGDRAELRFDALPERPRIPIVVRHVHETDRLAGVQFLVEGDLPAMVVEAASRKKRQRKTA